MPNHRIRTHVNIWNGECIARQITLRNSCPPGGELRYFHTYVGSDHFFGVKFFNFNIFGGFQKNEYFLGMKILCIFFWVIPKMDNFLGLFLCILGSFLKVNIHNDDISLGCKNFKYFFGVLEISDIVLG